MGLQSTLSGRWVCPCDHGGGTGGTTLEPAHPTPQHPHHPLPSASLYEVKAEPTQGPVSSTCPGASCFSWATYPPRPHWPLHAGAASSRLWDPAGTHPPLPHPKVTTDSIEVELTGIGEKLKAQQTGSKVPQGGRRCGKGVGDGRSGGEGTSAGPSSLRRPWPATPCSARAGRPPRREPRQQSILGLSPCHPSIHWANQPQQPGCRFTCLQGPEDPTQGTLGQSWAPLPWRVGKRTSEA